MIQNLEHARWPLLAWSIEWEGCIALTRRKGKRRSLDPKISISNKYKSLLQRVKDLIQFGAIRKDQVFARAHNPEHYSVGWVWDVCRQEDLRFILKKIIPFLSAKRKQAELLLEYVTIRKKGSPHHLPREYQIAEEIHRLNGTRTR